MQSTPRSRATSCTANDPDDASPSSSISQPSVLTSSRAMRAASCGWPLESRITISICRPASPPAALTFSTSSITRVARRGSELRNAAGQNRRHADLDGLGLRARHPWRCECHSSGAHQRQSRASADARFAGSLHFPLHVGFAFPGSLAGDRSVSIAREFQSKGGDVKPHMNYESEFIEGGNEAENRPFETQMINLSSFIAFHARRTPDRCALKYRGEDISYAEF